MSRPTQAELEKMWEVLGKLDTGMRCVVVNSQEEADRIFEEMEAEGYQCGAMSNAGLPKGSHRLTFLPKSAFPPEPEAGQTRSGPGLDEGPILQEGPPVSRQPQRPVQDWLDDFDSVRMVRYDTSNVYTSLPPLVAISTEVITTIRRGTEEVDYFDLGLEEHYPPKEGSSDVRGGVRSRIQTRQRIHNGDAFQARAEALRRSVDFAAGRLLGYAERDSGNGDPM